MRDLLLGLLSYVLSFGSLIGVMLACHWAFAPPLADRARSFTFTAGGGALMLAVMLLLVVGAIAFARVR